MVTSKDELIKENNYLNEVINIIRKLINNYGLILGAQNEFIEEFKAYMWENRTDMDPIEIASNVHAVSREIVTAKKDQKRTIMLLKAKDKPYFGRIDFSKKNGYSKTLYIGLISIEHNDKYYVYDWRAPICSMFYDYGLGAAYFNSPSGVIEGKITLKRQYKIDKGTLKGFFESDLNIVDEYLQEILSISVSKKLKNIVNTIQQEQNKIIRDTTAKYMIVQGVAGSGKTTVALHRVAYLLYKEKELLSNNVLIFSPNMVFSEYISDVLPDLGELNTLQTTFSEFAGTYISKNIQSFSSFLERYYTSTFLSNNEYKVIKYKLSDRFIKQIDDRLLLWEKDLAFKRPLKINSKIYSSSELTYLLKSRYSRLPLKERIANMAEYLCYQNVGKMKNNKLIAKELANSINIKVDIYKLYNEIITSEDFYIYSEVDNNSTLNKFTKSNIKYEDIIGILYLKYKLTGLPKDKNIKHIIIDEVQDYTLTQLQFIKNIFCNASFTVLGDKYQTINPYYRYESLESISKIFFNNCKFIELDKTYRSGREIVEFTNNVIGINNVCAIRGINNIPVVFRNVKAENICNQLLKEIELIKSKGFYSIAIITKDQNEAQLYYDKIRVSQDNVFMITNKSMKFSKHIVILPSYLSKGLEFDAVIVCSNNHEEYQEKDKYLYYVICTRALHNLVIYNSPNFLKRKRHKINIADPIVG